MPSRATLIADALRPKQKNEDAPDVFSAPDQSWADYLSSKASGAINSLQDKMRGPEPPASPVGMGIRGSLEEPSSLPSWLQRGSLRRGLADMGVIDALGESGPVARAIGPHAYDVVSKTGALAGLATPRFGTDSGAEIGPHLSKGDYSKAAIATVLGTGGAALDMIPGEALVKGVLRGVTKGVKTATEYVPELGMAIAAGKGKPTKMTQLPEIRDMTPEAALAAAKGEPHVIPLEGGGYIGAPRDVTNRRQLNTMRKNFDATLDRGAEGADWYDRYRDFVQTVAGRNPAKQKLLAKEGGEFSAGVSPEAEYMFTLREHNGYELGTPHTAHYPAQHERYMAAREANRPAGDTYQQNGPMPPEAADLSKIATGDKTSIYGRNADPTQPMSPAGTNDFRHAVNFGYTDPQGLPQTQALNSGQHTFLDYETVLAAQRANQRASGGRTDWSGPSTQAAPWVVQKAEAIMERAAEKKIPKTWDEAFAEANKTPADFVDKHNYNLTYEHTPYVGSGHRPDIAEGSPATKEAYANDPRMSWQDPEGRDALVDALGLYQQRTQRATGLYTPPGGTPEVNPAFVARPQVDMLAGGAGVGETDLAGLTKAQAVRGYFDAQGAAAGSKPILNGPPGQAGSLFVPGKEPLSLEQINQLKAAGAKSGLPDVVDYGPGGAALSNFGDAVPSGRDTGKALKGGLADEIRAITGGEAQRAKMDSIYPGYEGKWEEGGGAVTRQLQEYLAQPGAPAAMKRLDSPDIRSRVLARMGADAESGAQVNPALQNARKLFGEGGFPALFDALKAGIIPLPVVAFFLSSAQEADQQQGAARERAQF